MITTVRVASKEDEKELIGLIQDADDRTEYWAKRRVEKYLKKSENKRILVAISEKRILGYVFVEKMDDDDRIKKLVDTSKVAAIAWIAVSRSYRKRGIGSQLLKAAEKQAKRWGRYGVTLDCIKTKIPFYEKNKYKNLGYFIKQKNYKRRRQYIMSKMFKTNFNKNL